MSFKLTIGNKYTDAVELSLRASGGFSAPTLIESNADHQKFSQPDFDYQPQSSDRVLPAELVPQPDRFRACSCPIKLFGEWCCCGQPWVKANLTARW